MEDTMTTEQKIIRAKVGLLESGEGGTRPCVSQAAGVYFGAVGRSALACPESRLIKRRAKLSPRP
jgi:hypothetical protein